MCVPVKKYRLNSMYESDRAFNDAPMLISGDGPLFAGALDAAQHFAAVEALAGTVLLDDHHGQALHRLVGGEALFAGQALPAAADAAALIGMAGIHHLAFLISEIGTSHMLTLLILRQKRR